MEKEAIRKIRLLVLFFIIATAISGITAFPVYTELKWFMGSGIIKPGNIFYGWLNEVWLAIAATQEKYPFLFYGYDWLAFAHIVIAALFYGVYKDPVRNKFIIDWGMFCCIGVIPLAFICGPIRDIPLKHILIDCSFGIVGIIPLWLCRKYINELEVVKKG